MRWEGLSPGSPCNPCSSATWLALRCWLARGTAAFALQQQQLGVSRGGCSGNAPGQRHRALLSGLCQLQHSQLACRAQRLPPVLQAVPGLLSVVGTQANEVFALPSKALCSTCLKYSRRSVIRRCQACRAFCRS